MNKDEIVVLLDSVSRTIAGKKVDETDTTISIENPVIINPVPTQSGQMSLQLIPVFFREVLSDKNHKSVFVYNKSSVTLTNITDLEQQIVDNYNSVFTPFEDVAVEEEADGKVINLFGDKTDG